MTRALPVVLAASALVACGGNLAVQPGQPDASGTVADASTAPEADVGVGPQDSGAGSDVFVCAAPSAVCAGACVDTQTDPANCGGCGMTCGGTCQNARCVVQLAPGMATFGSQLALDATTVYWTGGGSVQRIAKTGGPTTTLVSTNDSATGLALDATYVYFAMAPTSAGGVGYIGRVLLGGGAGETLVSFEGSPFFVTVVGGQFVWTAGTQAPSIFGPLDALSLDGGEPLVLNSFASPATPPIIVGDMVVDCQEALPQQLEEDPLAGPLSPIDPLVIAKDLAACPFNVVADSSSLYWTDGSLLTKAPLSGGALTTLASSTDSIGALAVDSVDVYYVTQAASVASVQKVPASGGAATTLVTPQVANISSMAVDDTSVYFLGSTGLFKVTPK